MNAVTRSHPATAGAPTVDDRAARLAAARSHDPFGYLGARREGGRWTVRVFFPHAQAVALETADGVAPMARIHPDGIYEWRGAPEPRLPYALVVTEDGRTRRVHDPYAFPPQAPAQELYLFNQGSHYQAYRLLGSHREIRHGVAGVRFRVWAPNAERVSVIGDFNRWDGRVHPMASLGPSGVWELFVPELPEGALYKYELRNRDGGTILTKTDPYATSFQLRPDTAARTGAPPGHAWRDEAWLTRRAGWDWLHAPLAIYELHAGSWRRHPDGRRYTYGELAEHLIPYVRDLGYTHIELLPVMEHPFDESWGYQTTGYFAATSRYGSPDELRSFIDDCHRAGIGVILDWVPAHFPTDEFALAHFDGTALYEHEDPRLGFHPDWGTHVFNYGRNEVRSFLLSSAHYWLAEFHADGLRVDAVASMLYLDYSREPGQWLPNRYGGNENLEAIEFLRALNEMVHREFPGALTLAEESTAWPMVSRPTYVGGLGFSMKWNMGWMNDTLAYLRQDPVHRRYHHDLLTFGQLYAYSENFVLPLSHDEVVHGKGSLLDKMPGDAWQKFANLRLLLTYQMTAPGKKLSFMGNEFGQGREWDAAAELDWALPGISWHRGVQRLTADLNHLYRSLPALHELDFEAQGFRWIDCHDADSSVVSFVRYARDGSFAVVALNFTPVPRHAYRIGMPRAGSYEEILNSDSRHYQGSDLGNYGTLIAHEQPWMGFPASATLVLPPLGGVILLPR